MNVYLDKAIENIGKSMVKCDNCCQGVNNDPGLGILPRCLFFDSNNNSDGKGCVVVGLNPGLSNEKERQYYLKHGCTYDATMMFWEENIKEKHRYYSRLSKFINALGFYGSVLWTELVKCEQDKYWKGELPQQTFRICTSKYLNNEIEQIKADWPIFAVGRETYKALSYLFPQRPVLGVPHPTGSRGHFSHLFKNNRLRDTVIKMVNHAINEDPPRADWIRIKDIS